MSVPQADTFIEDKFSQFMSSTDGAERVVVINQLREGGLTAASDELLRRWEDERAEFLSSVGVSEEEVHQDNNGEIYYTTEESGTAADDDYDVREVAYHVPDYLDVEYFKTLIK